jgi:hypothetical protein
VKARKNSRSSALAVIAERDVTDRADVRISGIGFETFSFRWMIGQVRTRHRNRNSGPERAKTRSAV